MAYRQGFRFAVAGAALLWAGTAPAQDERRPVGAGEAAHARVRTGDCAGALDSFDRAIATSTSPELRRDRGVCHDKLGHPFPAIDDYRAYLTARPDAPDAEQLRTRLEQLESQVGIVKPADSSGGGKGHAGGASVEMSLSTSGGGEVGGAMSSGDGGKDLSTIEKGEQLDAQADASPLRRGTGMILGVVLDPLDYTKAGLGWAEIAGIDLRYSVSPMSTLLLEFNYDNINAGGTASALGGAGLLGGYEARFPLNPRVNDALLVAGTFSYEHLSQGATGNVFTALQPRGRLGYRHVFGPSFGLEAGIDAGLAFLHLTGNVGAVQSADTTSPLVGGHFALVLGF
jgi:hypothetical protein